MPSPLPLNVGLIGGGGGAFFGTPHQRAVHLDGTRRVTAAALRSNPEAALQDATHWAYPIKGYPSYQAMFDDQKNLPAEQQLDYVIVVTPNHAHVDPALKALNAGIAVFCEKPLTLNLAEADQLVAAVTKTGIPFAVAHTYLGHWSARLARHIVRSGLLGDIRWVDSYYLQGWLADRLEDAGQQQAAWRTDPKKSGTSNCGGDIGTHALMMLRYITGLECTRLSAHLVAFVEGRSLDDHFTVYGELSNGGKALIRASQICIGHKNDHGILVAGAKGLLRWEQEQPERLTVCLPGQPDRVYWRGATSANDGFLEDLPEEITGSPTLPSGHTEGFHDALARLHRDFEHEVRAWKAGKTKAADGSRYATVHDGRNGIAFIEAAVASSKAGGAWTEMA
jgi:predicted dehydrogenase